MGDFGCVILCCQMKPKNMQSLLIFAIRRTYKCLLPNQNMKHTQQVG